MRPTTLRVTVDLPSGTTVRRVTGGLAVQEGMLVYDGPFDHRMEFSVAFGRPLHQRAWLGLRQFASQPLF